MPHAFLTGPSPSGVSVSHLSDEGLVRRLRETVARDRLTTAEMLKLIAEVDRRRLYAATRHASMFAWCMAELGMSEDMAAKRIHVARAAREIPAVLDMIADGRLTLSAAGLLAPHLTPASAVDLLPAAAHRTNDEVRILLAVRHPSPEVRTLVRPLVLSTLVAASPTSCPETTSFPGAAKVGGAPDDPACESAAQHAARHVGPANEPEGPRVTGPESKGEDSPSPAPTHYEYRLMLPATAHEKIVRAKALLGHAVPGGEVAEVLERALDALIENLERRKFGTRREPAPRRSRKPVTKRGPATERHVPDRVKNAVWERDGGRCAFVDAAGRRCESRTRLEFDHLVPISRGGLSTAGNLRLLCRTHNRFEAERRLGAAFVRGRIERAAGSRAETCERGSRPAAAGDPPPP